MELFNGFLNFTDRVLVGVSYRHNSCVIRKGSNGIGDICHLYIKDRERGPRHFLVVPQLLLFLALKKRLLVWLFSTCCLNRAQEGLRVSMEVHFLAFKSDLSVKLCQMLGQHVRILWNKLSFFPLPFLWFYSVYLIKSGVAFTKTNLVIWYKFIIMYWFQPLINKLFE